MDTSTLSFGLDELLGVQDRRVALSGDLSPPVRKPDGRLLDGVVGAFEDAGGFHFRTGVFGVPRKSLGASS